MAIGPSPPRRRREGRLSVDLPLLRDDRDTAAMPPSIPKRIIQIYCPPPGAPAELPLYSRASAANLQLLNPTFEYLLFGKAEMDAFVATEFPEFRDVMATFPYPIQRFDFFRYLAVYRLGGFYFDLDIFLAESLEPLLGSSCVFPFEELTISDFLRRERGMDWEIANYGFGAAAGHPFIGAVISNCVRGLRDPAWAQIPMQGIPKWFRQPFHVPYTTGPGMVSRTLAENPDLAGDVTVLFPPDVCDHRTWQRFGEFGVHAMQGTWRKRDGFMKSRLRRVWETRKRRAQLVQSQKLGPRRTGAWRNFPIRIQHSVTA